MEDIRFNTAFASAPASFNPKYRQVKDNTVTKTNFIDNQRPEDPAIVVEEIIIYDGGGVEGYTV